MAGLIVELGGVQKVTFPSKGWEREVSATTPWGSRNVIVIQLEGQLDEAEVLDSPGEMPGQSRPALAHQASCAGCRERSGLSQPSSGQESLKYTITVPGFLFLKQNFIHSEDKKPSCKGFFVLKIRIFFIGQDYSASLDFFVCISCKMGQSGIQ